MIKFKKPNMFHVWWIVMFVFCFFIYAVGFPLLAILIAILFVSPCIHDILLKFSNYKEVVK